MEKSEPWLRSWRHWVYCSTRFTIGRFCGCIGGVSGGGSLTANPTFVRERLHSFNDKQVKKRIIHFSSLSSLRKACQNSLHINTSRQKCQFKKVDMWCDWRWPATFLWGTWGWYVNLSVNVIGRKLSCYVNSPIRSCLLNPFLTNYFASEITAFTYISHRCFRHQAAALGSSINFCYFLL